MTASPLHAADRPCRPKRDHYAGRGYERSRTAARSEIHTNNPERCTFTVLAICGRQGFRARAAGLVTFDAENWALKAKTRLLAFYTKSARRFCVVADASGLRGSVLPAFRRWRFNLCRFLAGWSSPLRFNSSQEPKRGLSNQFRSLSCAVRHDRNTNTGPRAWRAEKLSLSSIKRGVRL